MKLWRCPSCGTTNDATHHRCEKCNTRVEFLGSTDDDLTPAEREARRDRGAGKTVLGVFGILALLQIVLFAFAGIKAKALATCMLVSGIVFVGVYAVTTASSGATGSVARLLVGLLCTLAAILGLIIIFAATCASSFSLGGLH